MVSPIEAYKILNKSLLDVANDMVVLDVLEIDKKPCQVRLDETPYAISERRNRIEGVVVKAHDLSQYVNKFYSITLNTKEDIWLDWLINANMEKIDLTEFGEYL